MGKIDYSTLDFTESWTDTDVWVDAMSHVGERRRSKMKGYYSCGNCYNQFIYTRPKKERICPVCDKALFLVSEEDEWGVKRIHILSENTVIDFDADEDAKYWCNALRNMRKKSFNEKGVILT